MRKKDKNKKDSEFEFEELEPNKDALSEAEDDVNDDKIIDMEDIRKERKKEKNKKRYKRLLLILIVVALGAAAYLTRDKWVYRLEGILDRKPETIVNDGETQKGNFPISINSGSVNTIDVIDDNIVSVDDSHIYIYNQSGKVVNSFVHNLGAPVIRVAGRKMIAFDNGGNYFKVYNSKGELYSKTIDDSILYAEIGENGYTAVVTQTEKYPSCMTVFDNNGAEVYKWSSGQRIMDISFDDSGNGCYVSTFSSESGIIQSVIHHVKFNSTEEKMKSVKLDTLVIDTLENNNGDIWAVGDDKFYKLNDDGEILLEYEYTNSLVSYAINEYSASVAVKGVKRGSTSVAIFDSDSDENVPKLETVEHGFPKKILCSRNKVILLSDQAVDAFDLSGNCVATVEASSDYTDFVYLNNSVYFLGYREINKTEFKN